MSYLDSDNKKNCTNLGSCLGPIKTQNSIFYWNYRNKMFPSLNKKNTCFSHTKYKITLKPLQTDFICINGTRNLRFTKFVRKYIKKLTEASHKKHKK